MIMPFFNFSNLNDKQIEKIDSILFLENEKKDQAYFELEKFFIDKKEAEQWELKLSYWRWYVFLSWEKLYQLPAESVIRLIKTQIPVAILVGENALERLLMYIKINFLDPDQLDLFFANCQKEFLNSNAIIFSQKNETLTIKKFVDQMTKFKVSGNTLEEAEYLGKMKVKLLENNDLYKKFFIDSKEKIFSELLGIVYFFVLVDHDNLWYFLNHLDLSKKITHEELKNVMIEYEKNKNEALKENFSKEKADYFDIKEYIEEKFKKDESGQFVDVESVFAELQNIAIDEDDDKILELYFFNEQTGKFEWNDKLIEEEGYVGTK